MEPPTKNAKSGAEMVPKFVDAKMLGTTGWGEGKFKVQGSKFSAARPKKNGNDGKRLIIA